MEENLQVYILDNKLSEKHWWFRARNNLIYAALKNIIGFREKSNKKILDVGSGCGQLFPIWQKFGEVFSIESSIQQVEYQNKCYKDIIVWNNSFPDKDLSKYSYDLICMCDFLEHTQNPLENLKFAYNLLGKNGFLLLTVPAYKWMWTEFDKKAGHFKRYLRKELIFEAERSGFKTIYSSYFMTLLFPFAIVARKIIKPINTKNKESLEVEFTFNGKILNNIFYYIFRSESLFIQKKILLPFGLSILGIFKKI